MHAEPRHFAAYGHLAGAGLPHDRLARIAARQAFVGLKDSFSHAAAVADGPAAAWLRQQVRAAEHLEDLLLLRGRLFECLAGEDERRRAVRRMLRRSLDALFPDSAPRSAFTPF